MYVSLLSPYFFSLLFWYMKHFTNTAIVRHTNQMTLFPKVAPPLKCILTDMLSCLNKNVPITKTYNNNLSYHLLYKKCKILACIVKQQNWLWMWIMQFWPNKKWWQNKQFNFHSSSLPYNISKRPHTPA